MKKKKFLSLQCPNWVCQNVLSNNATGSKLFALKHCHVVVTIVTSAQVLQTADIPLAIIVSDLSETFISDSSNKKYKKCFCMDFSPGGYQEIGKFRFFLFLTVWTFFSSNFAEKKAFGAWNLILLTFLRYL